MFERSVKCGPSGVFDHGELGERWVGDHRLRDGLTGDLEPGVQRVDLDCVLLAGRHTLLDRSGADVLLPRLAERSVGVVIGARTAQEVHDDVDDAGAVIPPSLGAQLGFFPPP